VRNLIFSRRWTWKVLFCNITPCNLIELHKRFGGTYSYHKDRRRRQSKRIIFLLLTYLLRFLFDPQDGSNSVFWNVDKLLPDYTVSRLRKRRAIICVWIALASQSEEQVRIKLRMNVPVLLRFLVWTETSSTQHCRICNEGRIYNYSGRGAIKIWRHLSVTTNLGKEISQWNVWIPFLFCGGPGASASIALPINPTCI
jgi:hypothetical protein